MESRSILLVLALLAAIAALAQEAYRWVDEDGVVHYSDRPREGAEQISVAGSEQDKGNEIVFRSAVTMREVAQQVRRTMVRDAEEPGPHPALAAEAGRTLPDGEHQLVQGFLGQASIPA